MGTVCCKISKVDDDPLHVDENPPKVYFDPHDPALGKLILLRIDFYLKKKLH